MRRYGELHDKAQFHDGTFKVWANKSTDATPYHFSDGTSIIATAVDYAPDDEFLKGPSDPDDDYSSDDEGPTSSA